MGRRFSWLLSYGAICSLFALGASVFRGQESGLEALTEEQVLSLVTSSKLGAASAERIVEIIKKRGLQFSITEAFLLELQARETDPVILETLRALRRPGSESTERPEADWSRFLELVRAKALAYTDDLPNFICTQVTQRHVRSPPQRSWRPVDNFVAELTYFGKKEHYKILTVASNAATDPTIENLSGTFRLAKSGRRCARCSTRRPIPAFASKDECSPTGTKPSASIMRFRENLEAERSPTTTDGRL